jgi:hypothetical protein
LLAPPPGGQHPPAAAHDGPVFRQTVPNGDQGGNEIPLANGQNQHALWDNLLGRRHRLQDVDREVAGLSDRERFGDVWDSAGRETDIDRWAGEGRQLAESVVYAPVILEAVRPTPEGAKVAPVELPKAYLPKPVSRPGGGGLSRLGCGWVRC